MRISSGLLTLFALATLLPKFSHSNCGPGALKCSNIGKTNERALICDPSMNYVLFDHTCIQQNIPNCLITLDENLCKICKFGRLGFLTFLDISWAILCLVDMSNGSRMGWDQKAHWDDLWFIRFLVEIRGF